MWTIRRVEAENFMGFRRLNLDLTQYRGLTLIEGQRDGATGRSNGASKSTIFEAIHWCLTGKTMRRLSKANKVMHRWMKPGESTVVRLVIEVDGREFIPERTRSKSGIALRGLLDGADMSPKDATADGLQERIYATLGTDEKLLTATTLFSGTAAQFCQLTDSERKAMLERMIGAEHYGAASRLAATKMAGVESRLAVARSRVDNFGPRIDDLVAEKYREVSRCLAVSLVPAKRERLLLRKVQAASERTQAAYDALEAHYVEQHAIRADHGARRMDLEETLERAQAALDKGRARVGEIDTALAVSRNRLADVNAEVARLRADKHPPICPTCAQRWPDKVDRDHLAHVLADLKQRSDTIHQEAAPLTAEKVRLSDLIGESTTEVRRLQCELRDLSATLDTRRERTLLTAALEAEANLTHLMRELHEVRDGMPEDGGLHVDTSDVDARIAEVRAGAKREQEEVQDLTIERDRLEFWRKGFNKSGLPAFLLDASVPQMNDTVGRIAAALSDGELSVCFDPAAAKGQGDVFAVKVDYADGADDYDMSSNGEHTRVDLAVLFAVRDLVASRGVNQCTQLFLDEVMSGVDQAFADNFIGMLRTCYRDKDVFIISHDDAIKAQVDNVVTVVKKGRAAAIAGACPDPAGTRETTIAG